MNKYLKRKSKEYYWLRARTDHLVQTDEEHEAILKKEKELNELVHKMREVLEVLTDLLEENKPSTLRGLG